MPFPSSRKRHNYQLIFVPENGFITMTPVQHEPSPSPDNYFPYSVRKFIPNASYILDEIGPRFDSGRRVGHFPLRPVFHLKADLSGFNRTYMRTYEIVDGTFLTFDEGHIFNLPYLPDTALYDIIGNASVLNEATLSLRLPSSIQNDLSEQAWNYFSDILPAHVSGAEFVQGFLQFKELFSVIGDSIGKTISGGYLNYKFGWENLLSDLDGVSGMGQEVLDRLAFFRNTYGIPTRLGFKRNPHYTPTGLGGIYGGEPHRYELSLHSYKAVFRATAWITQTLSHMDGIEGFLKVLFGAVGFNNPVKALWNITPLSFVVDWFFNISQHLDGLTRIQPAQGWDVNDVSQSVKYEWVWSYKHKSNYAASSYSPVEVLIPCSAYARRVGLSYQWELLNPAGLSDTQLTLLAAMFHQFG